MTALLVERTGLRVATAGNIGPTPARHAAHAAGGAHRRMAAGLGAGAVELPARRRRHRRGGFEPAAAAVLNVTPGPSGLAWVDGRLRRGQGAHLRRPGGDGHQPRRCPGGGDGAGAGGDQGPRQDRRAGPHRAPLRPGGAAAARRLRPRDRGRHGLAGARTAAGRVAEAEEGRRSRDPPAAPDAGRRAARARPPQRGQRAGRAGPGHRHRLPAGADAARPARVPRRAAPCRTGRQRRRRRGLRRQQGHERRRHRGRAGRPGRRPGAAQADADPRRRRQGAGLRATGRPGRRASPASSH